MKRIVFIFLLLFAGWQLQGQTDETPERLLQMEQQVASGELSDDRMLSFYEWLMYEYYTRDMDKVRFYFQQATALSREKKPDAEQRFYTRMGMIFSEFNQRDSVAIYFDKAVQLLENVKDDYEKANVYDIFGSYYADYNDHENAVNAYLTALDYNEKDKNRKIAENRDITPNIKFEVITRHNIAEVRGDMLNYEKSLEEMLYVKKLINENRHIDFSAEEYIMDAGIADRYLYFNEYEKAFFYIKNSYQTALARGDLVHTVYGLMQFSLYYQHTGDFNKALTHAKEALEIAEKQVPFYLNRAEGVLARTYIYLKDYRTAIYHTERQKARTEADDYQSLEYIHSNLALIYSAQGDMKKATEHFSLYDKVKTNMSDENMHNAIQNMEVKYDVQQKENEIFRQQSEISRHKARQNMFIGGLSVAALLLVLLIYIVRLRTRRARELTEMNATKDRFFSIISHDLKNPAIAQRDALQILLDNAGRWDAASLSDYYKKLLKSADGQVDLLYSLLNWAQIQTGRMPYIPTLFDLVSTLQPDIGTVKNMAENKGVAFTVQTPPSVLVEGDDNMLVTVVRNLLINAVKFTPPGGIVTLDISPRTDGDAANVIPGEGGVSRTVTKHTVTIADTGIGMTAEQLNNLYKIDHQHSRRGTSGEQGSGLGLIVCRELLEKHGSRLHTESEKGKGSRFWFEL